jgi:hypothetical protein
MIKLAPELVVQKINEPNSDTEKFMKEIREDVS